MFTFTSKHTGPASAVTTHHSVSTIYQQNYQRGQRVWSYFKLDLFLFLNNQEIGALLPSTSVEPQSGHWLHNMYVFRNRCKFKHIFADILSASLSRKWGHRSKKSCKNWHKCNLPKREWIVVKSWWKMRKMKKIIIYQWWTTSCHMLTASPPPTSKRYHWKAYRTVPCRANFVVGKRLKLYKVHFTTWTQGGSITLSWSCM